MNTSILLIISILMALPANTQLEWMGEKVTPTELIQELKTMNEPKVEEKSVEKEVEPAVETELKQSYPGGAILPANA